MAGHVQHACAEGKGRASLGRPERTNGAVPDNREEDAIEVATGATTTVRPDRPLLCLGRSASSAAYQGTASTTPKQALP
jgi:hypothetical protein